MVCSGCLGQGLKYAIRKGTTQKGLGTCPVGNQLGREMIKSGNKKLQRNLWKS